MPVTTNPANRFDVNADGEETASDALFVINYLNDHSSQSSPVQPAALLSESTLFPDVDGDGYIMPKDALLLINRLNQQSNTAVPNDALAEAEGESPAVSSVFDASAIDAILLSQGDLATPTPLGRRTR